MVSQVISLLFCYFLFFSTLFSAFNTTWLCHFLVKNSSILSIACEKTESPAKPWPPLTFLTSAHSTLFFFLSLEVQTIFEFLKHFLLHLATYLVYVLIHLPNMPSHLPSWPVLNHFSEQRKTPIHCGNFHSIPYLKHVQNFEDYFPHVLAAHLLYFSYIVTLSQFILIIYCIFAYILGYLRIDIKISVLDYVFCHSSANTACLLLHIGKHVFRNK